MPLIQKKHNLDCHEAEVNKQIREQKHTTESLMRLDDERLLILSHSARAVTDEIIFTRNQLESKIKRLSDDALSTIDTIVKKEEILIQDRKRDLNDILKRLETAENIENPETKTQQCQTIKKSIKVIQGKECKSLMFKINEVALHVLHNMCDLGKIKLQYLTKAKRQCAYSKQSLLDSDDNTVKPFVVENTTKSVQLHGPSTCNDGHNTDLHVPPLDIQKEDALVTDAIPCEILRYAVENTDSESSVFSKSSTSIVTLSDDTSTDNNGIQMSNNFTSERKHRYLPKQLQTETMCLSDASKPCPRLANSSVNLPTNIHHACLTPQSKSWLTYTTKDAVQKRNCVESESIAFTKSVSQDGLDKYCSSKSPIYSVETMHSHVKTISTECMLNNSAASRCTSISRGFCHVCAPNSTADQSLMMGRSPLGGQNLYNDSISKTHSTLSLDESSRKRSTTTCSETEENSKPLDTEANFTKQCRPICDTHMLNNHNSGGIVQSKLSLSYTATFETRSHRASCVISDITLMSDHRIVLIDHYHNSIQLFAEDFTFIAEQTCPYPMGVCTIDANTIAVSLRRTGQIALYRVRENDFQHIIMIALKCECYIWNVVFKAGRLYIACDENNIHIVDIYGNDDTIIRSGIPTENSYLRYFDVSDCGDRIYLCEEKGLRCIDKHRRVLWQFTSESFPGGDKEMYGHILEDISFYNNTLLATHWTQSKIFEISLDGQFVQNVITDNLEHPRAMAIMENRLVVTQFNPHMTALNTRIVKVFEIKQ